MAKNSVDDDNIHFEKLLSLLDSDPGMSVGHDYALNDLRGFISTGCFVLDAEIGQGKYCAGWPIGRYTEIYGTEGVGKTTAVTEAMVSCQQGRGTLLEWTKVEEDGRLRVVPKVVEGKMKPGLVILADSEYKWPLDRAQEMGLDVDRIIRLKRSGETKRRKKVDESKERPLTVEEVLSGMERAIYKVKSNEYFQRPDVPVLFVWDSLAASPIEAEVEGDGLSEGIASKARMVRAAMRRTTGILAALNITVLVVNQVYDLIGAPGTKPSGGRGLKFHSTQRMQLKKEHGGDIVSSGKIIGVRTKFKTTKSSISPPTQEVSVPILFKSGFNDDMALIDFFLAPGKKVKNNPISKSGAWLKLKINEEDDPISFTYSNASSVLDSHPGSREVLKEALMSHLREG